MLHSLLTSCFCKAQRQSIASLRPRGPRLTAGLGAPSSFAAFAKTLPFCSAPVSWLSMIHIAYTLTVLTLCHLCLPYMATTHQALMQ